MAQVQEKNSPGQAAVGNSGVQLPPTVKDKLNALRGEVTTPAPAEANDCKDGQCKLPPRNPEKSTTENYENIKLTRERVIRKKDDPEAELYPQYNIIKNASPAFVIAYSRPLGDGSFAKGQIDFPVSGSNSMPDVGKITLLEDGSYRFDIEKKMHGGKLTILDHSVDPSGRRHVFDSTFYQVLQASDKGPVALVISRPETCPRCVEYDPATAAVASSPDGKGRIFVLNPSHSPKTSEAHGLSGQLLPHTVIFHKGESVIGRAEILTAEQLKSLLKQ